MVVLFNNIAINTVGKKIVSDALVGIEEREVHNLQELSRVSFFGSEYEKFSMLEFFWNLLGSIKCFWETNVIQGEIKTIIVLGCISCSTDPRVHSPTGAHFAFDARFA